MTSQSGFLSPIAHESGEGSGRVEPGGQVMAANGDDDMEWLQKIRQYMVPIGADYVHGANTKPCIVHPMY